MQNAWNGPPTEEEIRRILRPIEEDMYTEERRTNLRHIQHAKHIDNVLTVIVGAILVFAAIGLYNAAQWLAERLGL